MQTGDDSKATLACYLGATIRELRQRHDLTQVADQTGISRVMRSKIENAQTSTGLDVLHGIA